MQHFPTAGADYIRAINATSFDDIALSLFRYQYANNTLYRRFADALRIVPDDVRAIEQIPFLPISFFKTHPVITGDWHTPALTFESSGTTGEMPSRHLVKDAVLYETALMQGFECTYGPIGQYAILGLLPSYLERGNASLVHMAKTWMEHSGQPESGFYLNEWEQLRDTLKALQAAGRPALLIGVTFALLDFAEQYPMDLPSIMVMETGGMKGRREEWTRNQVHGLLKRQWQLQDVHSEYGMTELLSQAYAKADGIFQPTPSMKVLVRDMNDPLTVAHSGTGCINVIDLANVHSCAFIATDDIGALQPGGTFEVLGRADFSALRGCSLMTA